MGSSVAGAKPLATAATASSSVTRRTGVPGGKAVSNRLGIAAERMTKLPRSSARRMGARARLGVGLFYAAALALWSMALWSVRPEPLVLLALLPAALHLARQVARIDPDDGDGALTLFRSNRWCGGLLWLGFLAVGLSSAA